MFTVLYLEDLLQDKYILNCWTQLGTFTSVKATFYWPFQNLPVGHHYLVLTASPLMLMGGFALLTYTRVPNFSSTRAAIQQVLPYQTCVPGKSSSLPGGKEILDCGPFRTGLTRTLQSYPQCFTVGMCVFPGDGCFFFKITVWLVFLTGTQGPPDGNSATELGGGVVQLVKFPGASAVSIRNHLPGRIWGSQNRWAGLS